MPSFSCSEWDSALHLPLWIASNERKQIEAQLNAWVDLLLNVGLDVPGLSKVGRCTELN